MKHLPCGWEGSIDSMSEVYFRGELVGIECPKCGESCPFFNDEPPIEEWSAAFDKEEPKWIPRNRDKKNGARNEGDH